MVHAVLDRAMLSVHLLFGTLNGSVCLHPLSVLMILLIGPTPLASWFNGWLSLVPCIGLLVVLILGVVVSHVLNYLLFMSFGLVRGCLLRERFLVIFDQGVQFSVSAVSFGPGIDIWRSCRFIDAMMRSLWLLPGGLG